METIIEQIREMIGRLAELTDDELEQLAGLIDDAKAELLSEENSDRSDAEYVGMLTEVADAFDTVTTEISTRDEAKAEAKAKADELREKVRAQGEEPADPEPADPETADADDKEPVAAAVPARRSPAAARRPKATEPVVASAARPSLTAAANVPGLTAGVDLSEPLDLGKAFVETWRAGIGYAGGRHNVRVATLGYNWPEDRILDDNVVGNMEKIDAVLKPRRAVTAAGGICAPAPIDYSLPVIGTTSRPIRDALPSFGASRGAVRTLVPPTIETIAGIGAGNVQGSSTTAGGISIWTEANDQTPSAPATKPCLTVICGTDTTTAVDAITQCLQSGNFRANYFAESIAAWVELQNVWAARVAEQNLLAKIAAGSTTVTAGLSASDFGTTRGVLAAIDRYLADIHYWYRLEDNQAIRMLAPRWLQDNMQVDLAREQPGASTERLAIPDGTIDSWFSMRGVNMSWIMEGESTQRLGRPVAGGIPPWPSHVFIYAFLEGSWLYLNGGNLNLGIVRDSTLNGLNNFQMFEEVFEQAHFHGTFSHKLDIDICPSGVTQLPLAINVCGSGS